MLGEVNMHRSVNRVTRPKKSDNALPPGKDYPANCLEIEVEYAGQYLAYLERLKKGKPIWTVIAHSPDMVEVSNFVASLPPLVRRDVHLHLAQDPNDPVIYL